MPFSRILVPTDFSTGAAQAARLAAELAATMGGTIRLIHVINPPALVLPDGSTVVATPAQLVELTERADDELSDARRALLAEMPPGKTVDVEASSLMGDAADEILRLAGSGHYDLIVMGTHGRTGIRRLMLGSVAEKVLRHAAVPVLTVREADAAAAHVTNPAAAR